MPRRGTEPAGADVNLHNLLVYALADVSAVRQTILEAVFDAECLVSIKGLHALSFAAQSGSHACRWSAQGAASTSCTEFQVWLRLRFEDTQQCLSVTLRDLVTLHALGAVCTELRAGLPRFRIADTRVENFARFPHVQIGLRATSKERREESIQRKLLVEADLEAAKEEFQAMQEDPRRVGSRAYAAANQNAEVHSAHSEMPKSAQGLRLFSNLEASARNGAWKSACMVPIDAQAVRDSCTVKSWSENAALAEWNGVPYMKVDREVCQAELVTVERGEITFCANGVVSFRPNESIAECKASACVNRSAASRFACVEYDRCDDCVASLLQEARAPEAAAQSESCITNGMCELHCGTVAEGVDRAGWTGAIGEMVAAECEAQFLSQDIARRDFFCAQTTGTTAADALRRSVARRGVQVRGRAQMRRLWTDGKQRGFEHGIEALFSLHFLDDNSWNEPRVWNLVCASRLAGCVSVASRVTSVLRLGKAPCEWNNTTFLVLQWHGTDTDTWRMYRQALKRQTYDNCSAEREYTPDPNTTKPWENMHTAAGVAKVVSPLASVSWLQLGKTPEDRKLMWDSVWRKARMFARQFRVLDSTLQLKIPWGNGSAEVNVCAPEHREQALQLVEKRLQAARDELLAQARDEQAVRDIPQLGRLARHIVERATSPPPLVVQIDEADANGRRRVQYFCTSHVDATLCSFDGTCHFEKTPIFQQYKSAVHKICLYRAFQDAQAGNLAPLPAAMRQELEQRASRRTREVTDRFLQLRKETVDILRDAVVGVFAHAVPGHVE